jgi:ATP-dependent DNA helicase PIF1
MNPEQQAIFDSILAHPDRSVLITGPAGTGKTYLTKALIEAFQQSMPANALGITGSTGAAAVLIQGRTLHSFLGIGLAKSPADDLIRKMSKNQKAKLCRLRTLVVDEVSMLSASLIDLVDAVLRGVRSKDLPFGGVRCVFIGDACQLPPVQGAYFFLSSAWKNAEIQVFQLKTLVRQQGDLRFQELLSRARWGTLTPEDIALLKSRVGVRGAFEISGILPTRLYAINDQVDRENHRSYQALLTTHQPTPQKAVYKTQLIDPTGTFRAKLQKYAEQARIPPFVELCIGCQVMVLWNQAPETEIVNGTRGVVVAFQEDAVVLKDTKGRRITIPYATMDYHDETTSKVFYREEANPGIRFMPLKLAYGVSIHKSQGTTLDAAEINLGESIFEYGQAYTALTRVKSLEALCLSAFSPKAFRTHPDVLAFYGMVSI